MKKLTLLFTLLFYTVFIYAQNPVLEKGENGKYGFVDDAGNTVIPFIYDVADSFNDGLAGVKKGDKYGFIDKAGNAVIPVMYDGAWWFSDGLAAVKGDKWGFINKAGNTVIPVIYDAAWPFSEGLAGVKKDGKWGFIDKTGNTIIPFIYDYVNSFSEGLAGVKKGDKYGFIDKAGKTVIPVIYDYADSFSEGLAAVQKSDKMGFIDKADNTVIPVIYDYADLFSEGLAAVQKGDKWGFIDKAGKTVIPVIFDGAKSFSDGLAGVKKDGKCGFIDKTGKAVTPFKYEKVKKGNIAAYTVNGLRKEVYIDRLGQEHASNTERNLANKNIDNNEIITNRNLATVDWIDFTPETSTKDYALKLGIKSDSKIEDVSITVNDQVFRGISAVTNDGYDMTLNRTLSLSAGINTIKVSVRNAGGVSATEKNVTFKTPQVVVTKDRRLALVLGNAKYTVQQLVNPVNDATDLASKLEKLGFDVILKLNAGQEIMDKAIDEFGEKAKNYDVAMFYYAGHGIQSKGVNYLIPVDAELASEGDLKYKCVNAGRVLTKLEEANCDMKIVILDACRNNPFERSWHRGVADNGLAIMNSPKGTIIGYSTGPGSVAQDGEGRNSPYTEALLNVLDKKGVPILDFFQQVTEMVSEKTSEGQMPWMLSALRKGDFYFNPKAE
ncbi:MAG: WG repeat-containing protein [Bacteroidaceae bacterium]|nr:WG repeat-containing protein [Bacteroidaceae bacterium]